MGLIDQMKYAKILYLADVLEDVRNEMNRDYRCHSYAESISGIVKDLRETVAVETAPNEMECEKIEIKRIENSKGCQAKSDTSRQSSVPSGWRLLKHT